MHPPIDHDQSKPELQAMEDQQTSAEFCPRSSSSSSVENDGAIAAEEEKTIATTTADTTAPLDSSSSLGSVSTVAPSTPPRTPTKSRSSSTSPAAASPSFTTSPRPPIHLHPSNLKTPQMMVLGHDGSDYRDLMKSRSQQQRHERQQALLEEEEKTNEQFVDEPVSLEITTEGSTSTSLWNRLWYGRRREDNNSPRQQNGDYTSMDNAEAAQTSSAAARAARRPPPPPNDDGDVEAPVYYQGLDDDPLHSPPPAASKRQTSMHRSILRNLPLPSSKEEQLQQNCSFLYRPVDESPKHKQKRTTLRAILDRPPAGVSTLYHRDTQEVWSPPVMAQYKTKYEQLNQEYDIPDDVVDRFADYNDYAVTPPTTHELTLEEQQEAPGNNRALVTQTLAQSSLFYQHEANGRVVLRLPRDHVRLLVGGELEPGILSVIQSRRPEDPQAACLEYCLTVPPNLYQQVVSEMTQYLGTGETQHGLDGSFYASDHADIRWAIGIMVIIMTILGINTLVFGLD